MRTGVGGRSKRRRRRPRWRNVGGGKTGRLNIHGHSLFRGTRRGRGRGRCINRAGPRAVVVHTQSLDIGLPTHLKPVDYPCRAAVSIGTDQLNRIHRPGQHPDASIAALQPGALKSGAQEPGLDKDGGPGLETRIWCHPYSGRSILTAAWAVGSGGGSNYGWQGGRRASRIHAGDGYRMIVAPC